MKVLITGTARGIGKATAKLFSEKGHEVIGIDLLPSDIANKNYNHIIASVTDETLPEIDGVEILINNAGVQTRSLNDIDVNLKGTINITEKYAFNDKIRSVVMLASASAATGSEFPEYVASKGGVVSYIKNVAFRLAKYGATCNSVSPGGVVTPMNDHVLYDEKLYNAAVNESLLKKWASSEEIAEWIYFLSVVNKSMTGQDLIIDNGEMINLNFIW